MSYTKGKWYVNGAARDKGTARVCGKDGTIAECGPNNKATSTHFANARLIAAAPELLRACKNAEYAFASYLEEGRLVNAGDMDIMPIMWSIIEDMREAITISSCVKEQAK